MQRKSAIPRRFARQRVRARFWYVHVSAEREACLSVWPLNLPVFELRASLLESYAAPSRSYHDTNTSARCSHASRNSRRARLRPIRAEIRGFHDAIYDGRPSAEERSATWAQSSSPALSHECRGEVTRCQAYRNAPARRWRHERLRTLRRRLAILAAGTALRRLSRSVRTEYVT